MVIKIDAMMIKINEKKTEKKLIDGHKNQNNGDQLNRKENRRNESIAIRIGIIVAN